MMPLRARIIAAASVAGLVFAGCDSLPKLEGDKVEYKSAGRLPKLEVPPDLTRPSGDGTYTVPDINPRGQATYSAYSKERPGTPGASGTPVLPSQENARIERSGNQRWLVVKGEPDMVWNVAKEFWQEAGFIIDTEYPDAGVMETDWAESRAKVPDDNFLRRLIAKGLRNTKVGVKGAPVAAGERAKFRTRLERGTEPGTTEVYISHRGLEEVLTSEKAPAIWKSRPPDPELEAEMLRRLMARFGVKPEPARAAVAVTQPAAQATLRKGQDGAATLSVNDQFDRAWRRVGLALDRVGFTVEDRDRSKGLYFVRYLDPDADNKAAQSKGFLAKLNPFSKSDPKPASDRFRIQIKDGDSVSMVNVLGKDGNHDKSETANRILTLLYEQLR